jgi:hypothetical protein
MPHHRLTARGLYDHRYNTPDNIRRYAQCVSSFRASNRQARMVILCTRWFPGPVICPPHVNNGRSASGTATQGRPLGSGRFTGWRSGSPRWRSRRRTRRRRRGRARRLLARPMTGGGEFLSAFLRAVAVQRIVVGGAERLCVRCGTFGQDRSDRLGRDRLESSACQRPAARPQPRRCMRPGGMLVPESASRSERDQRPRAAGADRPCFPDRRGR